MHLTVRLKTGCDRESERASEHREAVKRGTCVVERPEPRPSKLSWLSGRVAESAV